MQENENGDVFDDFDTVVFACDAISAEQMLSKGGYY
jgi:hypothetical protein